MKKAVAVLLTCVAMLGLTACGGQKKEGWADADLDFKSASETVTVKRTMLLLPIMTWHTTRIILTVPMKNIPKHLQRTEVLKSA